MPKEQITDIIVHIPTVPESPKLLQPPTMHCGQETSLINFDHVFREGFLRVTVPKVSGHECLRCGIRFIPDEAALQIISIGEAIHDVLHPERPTSSVLPEQNPPLSLDPSIVRTILAMSRR